MTPKVREILYVVGIVIFAGLTVLSTFKIIDPTTAASISAAVTAVLGLFGVTGFGVAAYNTSKQIRTGAFNAPVVDAASQAAAGLGAVAQQYSDLVNQVNAGLQQVQQTATSLGGAIPVVAPINAPDSLAEAAIRASQNPGQYRA